MKSDIFDAEIKKYVDSVISEIKNYSNILTDKEIKSIYFGWWTPQLIWSQNLEKIIDTIVQNFDTENMWELSVEMNPYPKDEVLNIVQKMTKKYRSFSRVRFSFGIQSLDNKVLSVASRDITFPWLVDFFRDLQAIKKGNNIFNLDFIAFWQFNESKKWNFQLRNLNSVDFFVKLAESKFIDSYSIYTLELFPGSLRYYQKEPPFIKGGKGGLNLKDSQITTLNPKKWLWDLNPSSSTEQLPLQRETKTNTNKTKQNTLELNEILNSQFWTLNSSDDDIYEEFSMLKDIILDAGYKRYELSNFSRLWKSSIHNRVYREMWDYIWIWTSASSFIQNPNEKIKKYLWISKNSLAVRRNNTEKLAEYDKWNYLDQESIQNLSSKDLLIEEFFLALRTDVWVNDLSKYSSVLVKNIDNKIDSYTKQWFLQKKENWIKLTDTGMDIYNDIITELLQEI